MLRGSRSTVAIVTAVLAACGGAVSVASLDKDDAPPDGGTSEDASSPTPSTDASEAAPTIDADVNDAAWDGGPPCPPIDDPYWDQVFERSVETGRTTWGDASVCGVIEAGGPDKRALVNGDLGCVVAANGSQQGYYGIDAGCPIAICPTVGGMGDVPCHGAYQPDGDGGSLPSPILDDAGKCLLASDATVSVNCGAAGRRPHIYVGARASGRSSAGRFVAQAVLEAASITAFEELAEELREFGAPQDLVDACLIAAREEAEHARIMTALANRFGAEVPDAKPSHSPRRTLLACAIDNVVEGLVRETMAAAIALLQARTAGRDLRADLAVIARDEISHADLSRRIHAWVISTLDDDRPTRLVLADAMRSAIHNLAQELSEHAVWPAIFAGLRDSIWREELTALAA